MTHINLRNVSVQIPLYDSHSRRLIRIPSLKRASVGSRDVSHNGGIVRIHALVDLSISLAEGDRVCLIGHNGSGKTTLLRLMAGIYPPSAGIVDIVGSRYALLGSSMILNPEATGYENIRLAASIYNWPKESIEEDIKEIEEFTELGEYLGLPTRIYSAGMQARLGFAIATCRSSDILLIDEGIGAGDAQFREKAHRRVDRFVNTAKIIVLASHSYDMCRSICSKALILEKGHAVFFGELEEAFRRYNAAA